MLNIKRVKEIRVKVIMMVRLLIMNDKVNKNDNSKGNIGNKDKTENMKFYIVIRFVALRNIVISGLKRRKMKVTMSLIQQCMVIKMIDTFKMKEICNVVLTSNDDITISLNNVRHIPDLKRNLISLGVLDDIDFFCISGHSEMKVLRSVKLGLYGRKVNGLYILNGSVKSAALTILPSESVKSALLK